MKLLLCNGLLVLAAILPLPLFADSGPVSLSRITLGELGGWIEVPLTMAGHKGRWLIDTGSSRNLVSSDFARRHGLTASGSVHAETVLGPIVGGVVDLPPLNLGEFERGRQNALVADLALLFGAAAAGIDGVIGIPFLDGMQVDLDLRAWISNWRAVGDADCPAGLLGVDLKRHRTLPVITIKAGAALATESYVLDTGNPGALVRIESARPDASTPGLGLPGEILMTVLHKAVVGPQERVAVPVLRVTASELKKTLGERLRGLAGTALLDGARWQLDLVRNRLCVEPGQVATPGGFGLTLRQSGNVLELDRVLPNGPAERAGLRSGDIVTQWQGGSPTRPLAELWGAVHGQEEVTIATGDPTRLVTLRRTIFGPLETP